MDMRVACKDGPHGLFHLPAGPLAILPDPSTNVRAAGFPRVAAGAHENDLSGCPDPPTREIEEWRSTFEAARAARRRPPEVP